MNKLVEFLKSDTFKKLFKFGCIGVLNTGVDYVSFSLLHYGLGTDKFFAQFMAVVIAATNSYLLNNNITFKQSKQAGLKAYAQFMSVNFISVGVSLGLMYVFSDLWGLEAIVAKIPISILTILLSFTVYDKLIFKKRK